MWMEETIGERINENRTREAVGTGADAIAVGCPFCRVMLDDGLTKLQADGEAREEVEVLDVAQLLLAGVKRDVAAKAALAEPGSAAPGPGPEAPPVPRAAGESEPAAPATEPAATATPESPSMADSQSGGEAAPAPGTEVEPEPVAESEPVEESEPEAATEPEAPAEPKAEAKPKTEPEPDKLF
jgi:hypothetical protein